MHVKSLMVDLGKEYPAQRGARRSARHQIRWPSHKDFINAAYACLYRPDIGIHDYAELSLIGKVVGAWSDRACDDLE